MHFSTNDGREGRAANRLRAQGADATSWLLRETRDGIVVGEGFDDYEVVVFDRASEELLTFVATHSADCALLAYVSDGRSCGDDDMRTAAVWPAGQWPRIKLLR